MKRLLFSLLAMLITSVCLAQDDNNNKRDVVTKETVTQFSNDEELLDIWRKQHEKAPKVKEPKTPKVTTPETLYKRGKRMKTAGYIVGGTLITGGIVSMIVGANSTNEHLYVNGNSINHYIDYYDRNLLNYIGASAIAAGVGVGVPLVVKGSSLQKKYGPQVYSMSVISHDINFSNGSSLNLGVDMLSSNLTYTKTPGFGVRFNF